MTPEQLAKSGSEAAHQFKIESDIVLIGDGFNAARLKLRQNRIDNGLCRDCGKNKPFEDLIVCKPCHEKRNEGYKKRRKAKVSKGVCTKCGTNHNRQKHLCEECSAKQIEQSRQVRKANKLAVVAHFGGKCESCGEQDVRTLTIDHIENDGSKDCAGKNGKRILAPTWYARLVKAIKDGSIKQQKLQLLCFNCHAKKDLKPWWFDET